MDVEPALACLLNAAIMEKKAGKFPIRSDFWSKLIQECSGLKPTMRPKIISQAVLRFSAAIVDALPKKTIRIPEREALGFGDKMTKHNLLFECLAEGNCFLEGRISVEVISTIFDHQEKVNAASKLWSLLEGMKASSSEFEKELECFDEVIRFAGDSCRQSSSDYERRYDGWDLFFARPSTSIVALMQAISIRCQMGRDKFSFLEKALYLSNLSIILKEACQSGLNYRSSMGLKFPSTSTYISRRRTGCWISGQECREARSEILQACKRLYSQETQGDEEDYNFIDQLYEECLVELLDSFQQAISYNNLKPVKDNLMESYLGCCDDFLGWLVMEAKDKVNSLNKNTQLKGMESIRMALKLGKKHYAFRQIFDICDILDDKERLFENMAILRPRPDLHNHLGFSSWVFKHLMDENRMGDLLSLPDSLNEELLSFLAPFPNLLWRIQVRMGKFQESLSTLTILGQRTHNRSEACHALSMAGLTAKIAHKNAGDENEASRLNRAEGDSILGLARLKAQDALNLGPAPLMSSESIVETVLSRVERSERTEQRVDLLRHATDIFAKSKPSFRENQHFLWERLWRHILDAEEWSELDSTGFSDGIILQNMPIYEFLSKFKYLLREVERDELIQCIKNHREWDSKSSLYLEKIFQGVFGVAM